MSPRHVSANERCRCSRDSPVTRPIASANDRGSRETKRENVGTVCKSYSRVT